MKRVKVCVGKSKFLSSPSNRPEGNRAATDSLLVAESKAPTPHYDSDMCSVLYKGAGLFAVSHASLRVNANRVGSSQCE